MQTGLVAVAITVTTVALARGPTATERPAAEPETIFFDDFASPALDRTKWQVACYR